MSKAGYLYVLINPSIPGKVKIGRTERRPEDRMKELSSATGVPTPFELYFSLYFNDCHKAEKDIHNIFNMTGNRTSNDREFFLVPAKIAKKEIEKLSKIEKAGETNENNNGQIINELIKEGFKWLNGDKETLKNEENALNYFEQAASLESATGAYYAGITCEKINRTGKGKKKKSQQVILQRALNNYTKAISLGDTKSCARASWLYRKFQQYQESNELWNLFLTRVSERDKIDKDCTTWIVKWVEQQGSVGRNLEDHPVWKKFYKELLAACTKELSPKGFAKKLILSKNRNSLVNKLDDNKFLIIFFILAISLGMYLFL